MANELPESSAEILDLSLAVVEIAEKSSDPTIKVQAATILKYAIEDRKTRAEIVDLERKRATESYRFYIPIIAPLLSALAVMFGLGYQARQLRVTSESQEQTVQIQKDTAAIQRLAADDAQWREVTRVISTSDSAINGMTGTVLLVPFIRAGQHIEEARSLGLSLLPGIINVDGFENLFNEIEAPMPVEGRLLLSIQISRSLYESWQQNDAHKIWFKSIPAELTNPTISTVPSPDHSGPPLTNPYWAEGEIDKEVSFVASQIADAMRNPQIVRSRNIELKDCALWRTDWHDVIFGNANIENASFANSKIDRADLSQIGSYINSRWAGTAWWKARVINPELLLYLSKIAPFSAGIDYPEETTQADYLFNLNRLRASGLANLH